MRCDPNSKWGMPGVPKSRPVPLEVNGLPYEQCTKAELAEEVRRLRAKLAQVRKVQIDTDRELSRVLGMDA